MTKNQLAAAHVRRLRTIRKSLQSMATEWADVDEYNISRLTELADHAEDTAVNLLASKEAA